MDVSKICGEFGGWRIVGDVAELVVVIFEIANAMLVIAGVPDLLWCENPRGEGVSALDQLNAFWQRMI